MPCAKCRKDIKKAGATSVQLSLTIATRNNHRDCLNEIIKNNPEEPLDYEVMYEAIVEGHTDMVAYLISKGCSVDDAEMCDTAAHKDNIQILQILNDNKCPRSANACAEAAAIGSLSTIMWLRDHDFPWDEMVYINGLYARNMDILKYAHAHNCPISYKVFEFAKNSQNDVSKEAIEYLKEIKCPETA